MRKGRIKTSPVWRYFTPLDNDPGTARCDICQGTFSFRSTTANLKSHLRRNHTDGSDEALRAMLEQDGEGEIYLECGKLIT